MTAGKLHIHAKGKVLLTGEYAVLAGAKALAFPARKGQSLALTITPNHNVLQWHSKDIDGPWFHAAFSIKPLQVIGSSDQAVASRLLDMLQAARTINRDFLNEPKGISIVTSSDFPRGWGLGTSSTLIYLLSVWAGIDPFLLLKMTIGGSGYDIACAGSNKPIIYQLSNQGPEYEEVSFSPPFLDALYLVYSGKKMSTAVELEKFNNKALAKPEFLEAISNISQTITQVKSLEAFRKLIEEHEMIIADMIQRPRAKTLSFSDYPDTIKSLGAWGGDMLLFIWEGERTELQKYIESKGLSTLIPFNELLFTA